MQDWAEIRRLHQAEGLSNAEIARRVGVTRLTVRRALASTSPPKYERAPTGSAADAYEESIRQLLARASPDAGHGARRAGGVDPRDDGVQAQGRPAAAAVPAAGPGLADHVPSWGGCPVRLLVPAHRPGCRARAGQDGQAVAGADDGVRVLPVARRVAGPLSQRGGPVRRLVGAAVRSRRGAEGAGVGWRIRGRQVPPARTRAHRCLPRLPWGRWAPRY